MKDPASEPFVTELIGRALEEDLGRGVDVTSAALLPPAAVARARLLARERTVVAGGGVARRVFQTVEPALDVDIVVEDGGAAGSGDTLLRIEGPARGMLTAERTALNIMQRLCGIATLTRRFVELVRPYGTQILDTRKTTPGLRRLEKYAVVCGGGTNHRMGLYDRALIKDNHRHLGGAGGSTGLADAVQRIRAAYPGVPVEVEVESMEELVAVLFAEPEWVLLDNMSPADMARCVRTCDGRARVEASGGITLENADAVARSGVDAISLGCLTHSAPSVDLSLEIVAS